MFIVKFNLEQDLTRVFRGNFSKCGNNTYVLSNDKQNIEDFKTQQGDFYNDIKNLLETTLNFDISKTEFIFYVPNDMLNHFIDLFRTLFAGKNKNKSIGFKEVSKEKLPSENNNILGGPLTNVQQKIVNSKSTSILEGKILVNISALQNYVDKTTKENNGVSGILIFDKRGETLVKSSIGGPDGSVDFSVIEATVSSITDMSRVWATGEETSALKEKFKGFTYLLIGFHSGELIITFVEDKSEPCTIVFINLDSTKSGAARKTARTFTSDVKEKKLLE